MRRIAVFTLAPMLALALAACGGTAATPAGESKAGETQGQEVASEPGGDEQAQEDSVEPGDDEEVLGAPDDPETREMSSHAFSQGEWEFVQPIMWSNGTDSSSDTDFDEANGRCIVKYSGDQVEFTGSCDMPEGPVLGGEVVEFPISLTVTGAEFDEGYRYDTAFMGVAMSDVENPHDLWLSDDNAVRFLDSEGSDDHELLEASVWVDPVDHKNRGSEDAHKNVTWRFPVGTRDGQKLTIWFVDEGDEGTGSAAGAQYVWRSSTGVEANAEPKIDLDSSRDVSEPIYVLTGYELYPGEEKEGGQVRDCALYVDEKGGRTASTYLVYNYADSPNHWGLFESVYDFPPLTITAGQTVSIRTTNTSLGGYGFAASLGAYVTYGRDVQSWKDAGTKFREPDGEKFAVTGRNMEKDVFGSVSRNLEWTFESYDFPDDGKPHTLKIVYCDNDGMSGSAIMWNYELVR